MFESINGRPGRKNGKSAAKAKEKGLLVTTVDLLLSKLLVLFNAERTLQGLIYYMSIIRLLRLCFSISPRRTLLTATAGVLPQGSLTRLIHAPKKDTASTVRSLEYSKIEENVIEG